MTEPTEKSSASPRSDSDSIAGGNRAKNPADYLSYKAHETTEDHIAKGQEKSRRRSQQSIQNEETRPSESRLSSTEQIEPNLSTQDPKSGEHEQYDNRHLSRTQSGKSSAVGRRPNPRKPAHSRSQSHTKVHTRSSQSAGTNKPHLSRSKSTDGIIPKNRPAVKRNNRSHTKLSQLQPLTKTMSNSSLNRALGALQPLTKTISRDSLKSHGLYKTVSNGSVKGGSSALSKTSSNQSIKSNKSASSLKSMNTSTRNGNKSTSSLKGLTGLTPSGLTGLKTSTKRGKAILSLNEDDANHEFEDLSEDSEAENETNAPSQAPIHEETHRSEPEEPSQDKKQDVYSQDDGSGKAPELTSGIPKSEASLRHETGLHQKAPPFHTAETRTTSEQSVQESLDSKDADSAEPSLSNNFYGGSFLLSQSTGMTRKIDPSSEMLAFASSGNVADGEKTNQTSKVRGEGSNKVQESASGLVFTPRDEDRAQTGSQPAVAKASVTQGSYQPNQTIFSNLQRNDSKYLSNIKQQKKQGSQSPGSAALDQKKDFANYLNNSSTNGQNIETRTQQRLWLQRENSLLDVSSHIDMSRVGNFSNLSLNKLMFAHNYNNSVSNARDTPGSMLSRAQTSESGSADADPNQIAIDANTANMLYLIQSGQPNSIQSRTEFERLNREYVNVRRHLNPVAESLSRIQKHEKGDKDIEVQKRSERKGAYATPTNANTFKEFAPSCEKEEGESMLLLNKIWQDALISSSSSTLSSRILQQEQQRHLQTQQPRSGDYSVQNGSQDFFGTNHMKQQRRTLGSSMTMSSTPSTRTVKMAVGQGGPDFAGRRG